MIFVLRDSLFVSHPTLIFMSEDQFRASGDNIWPQLLNFPAGGNVPVIFQTSIIRKCVITSAPRRGNRFLKMPRRADLGQI